MGVRIAPLCAGENAQETGNRYPNIIQEPHELDARLNARLNVGRQRENTKARFGLAGMCGAQDLGTLLWQKR